MRRQKRGGCCRNPLDSGGSFCGNCGGNFFDDVWGGIKKGAQIVARPLSAVVDFIPIPGAKQVSQGINVLAGAGISGGLVMRCLFLSDCD